MQQKLLSMNQDSHETYRLPALDLGPMSLQNYKKYLSAVSKVLGLWLFATADQTQEGKLPVVIP